jgi:hypothetical protein
VRHASVFLPPSSSFQAHPPPLLLPFLLQTAQALLLIPGKVGSRKVREKAEGRVEAEKVEK